MSFLRYRESKYIFKYEYFSSLMRESEEIDGLNRRKCTRKYLNGNSSFAAASRFDKAFQPCLNNFLNSPSRWTIRNFNLIRSAMRDCRVKLTLFFTFTELKSIFISVRARARASPWPRSATL